jgi:hypothetical protein
MEISYESLKSIIIQEEFDGKAMNVRFRAAGQTNYVEGRGALKEEKGKVVANAAAGAVKQGVIRQLINTVSRMIGGSVGGAAGSIASSATSQASLTLL